MSATRVPHVASYTRTLPVSLERLYENALDWEHLPWLHRSTFASIECEESGDWGWRAWTALQPEESELRVLIELRLDRAKRRWVTRTLQGPGEGTEIWTHAFAMSDARTDIVVDFFVPGLDEDQYEAMGAYYRSLYAQLYDEDVSMMSVRQDALDRARVRTGQAEVDLGPADALEARLPIDTEFDGMAFKVARIDGDLLAYATMCPHLLGPLGDAEPHDGVIECPWHGYRFDVRNGRCVSGERCRLPRAPRVEVRGDRWVLVAA